MIRLIDRLVYGEFSSPEDWILNEDADGNLSHKPSSELADVSRGFEEHMAILRDAGLESQAVVADNLVQIFRSMYPHDGSWRLNWDSFRGIAKECTPQYRVMFIEANAGRMFLIPEVGNDGDTTWFIDGVSQQLPVDILEGSLVYANETADGTEVLIHPFWSVGVNDKREISQHGFWASVRLDEQGNIVSERPTFAGYRTPGSGGDFEKTAQAAIAFPLFVMSYMNCINIGQQHISPARHDRKACERILRGESIKYKILNITKRLTRSSASETTIDGDSIPAVALHNVRGHFKTFEDKGLFGKYKGRFWWGHHARGSIENGIIDKDYSIGQPRHYVQ